jgi:stress response protein SCP2
MLDMTHGQRLPLQTIGLTGSFTSTLHVDLPGATLDYAVFGLDAQGQLSDERYMVFYNQPASPCGAVRQEADGRFAFALDRLPATIQRLVIAASIEGAQTMGQSRSTTLTFADAAGPRARLATTAGAFAAERALMVAELYRKDGTWRCWASLQGFNGGLDALLTHFGGTLAEPETTTPPPAAVPPRVSLEKRVAAKAPQLVSLAKTASVVLEKRRLLDTVARVALVLDASGSMSRQYSSGRVQEVVERILPLAVHFDDDGALDCWAFADRELPLAPVTLDNVQGYIAREQGGVRQWNRRIGGSNHEPSVIRSVIDAYRGSALPAYVIFISDGGVGNASEIKRLLVEASALPIFWQFVGIGGSRYGVLQKIDTMSGRKVDNANFFALDDLRSVSEAELYERLLGEFPDWLVAARRAGVLS